MRTIFRGAIVLHLFLFATGTILAQQVADTGQIRQIGKGYMMNGQLLSVSEVTMLLEGYDRSMEEVRVAKAHLAPMYLFSISGGILIGWPLGTWLAGGEPKWWMAGVGVGVVLCAIPFQIGYKKHFAKAVTLYNSRFHQAEWLRNQWEIGILTECPGIVIKF